MNRNRTALATATALVAVGALAACSSGGGAGSGDGGDAASGTYTWWDPYPQHDGSSDWEQRAQQCGEDAGVTIERTAYDTTALTNQALLAAQEGTSPDIILLDNPAVSTLAETGMLTTVDELGLDTSAIDENLLDAGVVDGAAYGIPIGANTLSLYYNADVLDDAGVDPASITDWETLTAALKDVDEAGHRGITFAGIGTEEGTFQFLPWFWGAGADLGQLDSPGGGRSSRAVEDMARRGLCPQLRHRQFAEHGVGGVPQRETSPSPRTARGRSTAPQKPISTPASCSCPAATAAWHPPRRAVSSSWRPSNRTTPAMRSHARSSSA